MTTGRSVGRDWSAAAVRPNLKFKQEAQLSQRDSATLLVIEFLLSHSRSLKVIRNDTVE